MGKYLAFAIIIIVVMFFLEFLEIVDIPYFEVPDFTGSRDSLIESSEDHMKKRFGD